ncbi:MAG: hypothetical protein O9327_02385 [Polaromonas sp.]|nr:hypothetical protein [Polaromonas sp.]
MIAMLAAVLAVAALLVYQTNAHERALEEVRIAVAEEVAKQDNATGAAVVSFAHGMANDAALTEAEKAAVRRYLEELAPRIADITEPWPLSLVINRDQKDVQQSQTGSTAI